MDEKVAFEGFEEIMKGVQFGSYVAPGVADRFKRLAPHMPSEKRIYENRRSGKLSTGGNPLSS